jgi:hypothetical protein
MFKLLLVYFVLKMSSRNFDRINDIVTYMGYVANK